MTDRTARPVRSRRRVMVLAVAALAVVATSAVVPSAQSTKYFASSFGSSPGSTGGLFSDTSNGGIGGIAVNHSHEADGSGADGWTYVADRGNNRVQAFDANGVFRFAIGRDVVNGIANPGATGDTNEIQTVTVGDDATGGDFTLSFGVTAPTTTAPIPFDASADTVDVALGALGGIGGAANIQVSGGDGGPYTIEFVGARASVDQAQITANAAGLTPPGTVTVATTQDGASFEKCVSAPHCKAGTGGGGVSSALGNGGALSVIAGVDIDQSTGDLYVRERNPNARVQQFTADGDFVRAFGWDVVRPGRPGEVVEEHDEHQTVTLSPSPNFGSVSGGTFTLSFDGGSGVEVTAPIPYNAPASGAGSVEEALEALPALAPGDVAVSSLSPGSQTAAAGGPYTVRFTGAYAAQNIVQMVGNGSGLVTTLGLPGLASVATILQGGPGPGFETCTEPGDCKAAITGQIDGQFGSDTAAASIGTLTVAPSGAPNAGLVYVGDPTNCRVLVFDVSLPAVSTEEAFGACGVGDDRFDSGRPREVVAGPDGVVYATNSDSAIKRFDSHSSAFLADIPGSDFLSGSVFALAVHPTANHLFVAQGGADGVAEVDVSGKPELFDDPTRIVDRHFVNSGMGGQDQSAFRALAIDPETGRLFGTTRNALAGTGTGHRVLVLSDSGVTPVPTVEILAPQNVSATTAVLNASINPNGVAAFPTSYRFQVSKDGIDWVDKTPAELVGGTGTGSTPELVQQDVTGLEPGTDYLVRVVTMRGQNGIAGTIASAEFPLRTDAAPPVVVTGAPQQVSDVRAHLMGTLNPGGRETSYWFEWGDTQLRERLPLVPATSPATGATLEIGEPLTALAPGSVYHYRLCARNELTAAPVCGAVRRIDTRTAAVSSVRGRIYEMATSPDKVLRRGGDIGGVRGAGNIDYSRALPGWPAASGGRVAVTNWAGIGDAEAGHGFASNYTWEVRRRRTGGVWLGDALLTVAPPDGGATVTNEYIAQSADLDTHVLGAMSHSPFGGNERIAVRQIDDDGGPRGGGLYPWLSPPWTTGQLGVRFNVRLRAVIDDSGTQLVAQPLDSEAGGTPDNPAESWRNVIPGDGGPAAKELSPAQVSGQAVLYATATNDWRPWDLVNECTGTPAGGPAPSDAPTLVPTRTAGGAIGVRDCGAGSPTDVRGATLGSAGTNDRLRSTQAMAMSHGGRRIFFMSPDPAVATGEASCGAGTGASTACPAQLFVRAYDSQGRPVVRWISRAEDELFEAPQQVGLFGNGATYEGASRNGSVVYFRTNAPLTTDDPNGGPQLPGGYVTGTASSVSWDLYRYELPSGDGDPADGVLTRVSGGPDGIADANTNCATASGGSSASNCGGTANGAGSVLRFLSDDGNRAYFVTAGRIGGADDMFNQPPAGSSAANVSSNAGTANATARNLYYYDAAGDTYRFVASLPLRAGLDRCASFAGPAGGPPVDPGATDAALSLQNSNCVHGSGSGDAIVFTTAARLTDDDVDEDFDVYVYDAATHSLTRVSAAPPSSVAYPCVRQPDHRATPQAFCNGDLGFMSRVNGSAAGSEPGGASGGRHWNLAQDVDGRMTAVYFQSRLPLADGDGNVYDSLAKSGGMDVYEWNRTDGRLSLVSPGATDDSAFYSGNSLDGRDVFFWTEERLSPWEIDDADGDIYNWTSRPDRLGPPPSPDICGVLAGGCQGGGASRLAAPVGSVERRGVPRRGIRLRQASLRPPSGAARRLAARTGVLRIRLRAGAQGRITVRATARIRGRTRLVARSSRRFARAGASATVALRLSRAARARLRSGRPLRLRIVARPATGVQRTLTVTLRRRGAR